MRSLLLLMFYQSLRRRVLILAKIKSKKSSIACPGLAWEECRRLIQLREGCRAMGCGRLPRSCGCFASFHVFSAGGSSPDF